MPLRSEMIEVLAKNEFDTSHKLQYLYAGYTWDELSDFVKDTVRLQVSFTVDLLLPTVARYTGERSNA
jgi:hypothetical protein